MVGNTSNIGASNHDAVSQFVAGTQAKQAQVRNDMATSVGLGVLSAALFSKFLNRKRR